MSLAVSDDEYNTIKQLCISLILSNKTLGTKEASRFPEIPYNTIQHIYRYSIYWTNENRQCYHELESEQESKIRMNISFYIEQYFLPSIFHIDIIKEFRFQPLFNKMTYIYLHFFVALLNHIIIWIRMKQTSIYKILDWFQIQHYQLLYSYLYSIINRLSNVIGEV